MKGIKRLLVGMVALCFGLLFFFMYISTVWVLGVSPFLELRHNYALADRLRETEPTSWETLPSRDPTGTVLLQGHPSQYLSESSSLRTNGLYDTDQIDKPDFDLRGPSASVRVTNGCFREFDGMFGKLRNIRHTMNLGDGCYQLGDGDSSAAYGGFAPDDVVWVIGKWDDEALHAEAVFDGTPERYASSLEHWAWLLLLVTALGLGVFAGGLHLIVTQIPWPTHRRRKAEKIRVWQARRTSAPEPTPPEVPGR